MINLSERPFRRCLGTLRSATYSPSAFTRVTTHLVAGVIMAAMAASGTRLSAEPTERPALTDPASLMPPLELFRPGADFKSALRELQAAIDKSPDAEGRTRLRLKMVNILQYWASNYRFAGFLPNANRPAEHQNRRQQKMRELHARAVATAEQALLGATSREMKATANWQLGHLHDSAEEYKKAIAYYLTLLDRYADVDIAPQGLTSSARFSAYDGLTGCYAAVGDRQAAIDACLRAISTRDNKTYRGIRLSWLLEYEPRVGLWASRLSEEMSKDLAAITTNSGFTVTLQKPNNHLDATTVTTIPYRVRSRIDRGIEWYRLVFRVWRLPDNEQTNAIDPRRADILKVAGKFAPGNEILRLGEVSGNGLWGVPIRQWDSAPEAYHLNVWHRRFITPPEPIDANIHAFGFTRIGRPLEITKPTPDPKHSRKPAAARSETPEHVFDGRTLDRQGELYLGHLPPGRYLVSVPVIDFQQTFSRQLSNYPGPIKANVWCEPVEIVVPNPARRKNKKHNATE